MGQTQAFAIFPQPRAPRWPGLRTASRLAAMLAALTFAPAAQAQSNANQIGLSKNDLVYIGPTIAACSLDDLSMETRTAGLKAAGWEQTLHPEVIFQRRLSTILWGTAPSVTNTSKTIASVLPEAHDSLVMGYMKGLQDPATVRAFLRRDDPTASLLLYRDGDDSPGSARSRCDLVTGALDDRLLAMAGLTERPQSLAAPKESIKKGGPVGDLIMATFSSIAISPPDTPVGSITLHAFTRLTLSTNANDPDWLEAMMAETE